MYRRALDGMEKAWRSDNTSTLEVVENLGVLYHHQGKSAEAEKMYRRAVDGYMKTSGPDHRYTLAALDNLRNLQRQGDDNARRGGDGLYNSAQEATELFAQSTNFIVNRASELKKTNGVCAYH